MAKRQRSGPAVGSRGAERLLRGTVAAATDLGRTRPNNEDNYLVFDLRKQAVLRLEKASPVTFAGPGLLLAVADGMGGHSAGQVASQLCVDRLPVELLKIFPDNESPSTNLAQRLKQAVEATNKIIYAAAQQETANKGMGTTLTAAWIVGSQAIVAQVGDSRAYHLHQGQLTQLTRDQTVLNTVSEEERAALLNTPLENMLLQAVGAMAHVDVVTTSAKLAPGDYMLLCSDGLYRVVSPEQMREILQPSASLQKKVETLIEEANEAGGPDNVTAVVCEVLRSESE